MGSYRDRRYGKRYLKKHQSPHYYKKDNTGRKIIIILLVLGAIYLVFFSDKVDLSNTSSNSSKILDLFKTDPEEYRTNPKEISVKGINFVVYGGVNDYLSKQDRSISYYYTPPSTKDFVMKDLDNKVQEYFLSPFVEEIRSKSEDSNTQAKIAVSIVQRIPYDWESFETGDIDARYPYEVLYDMTGVCMEKAGLLTYLLRDLGFGVAIFEFEEESHRAVGIKCNNGNYNSNYCFIEPTDDYSIGSIPQNYVGGADIRNAIPEIVVISDGLTYPK